jgi:hypothetical protein
MEPFAIRGRAARNIRVETATAACLGLILPAFCRERETTFTGSNDPPLP